MKTENKTINHKIASIVDNLSDEDKKQSFDESEHSAEPLFTQRVNPLRMIAYEDMQGDKEI